MKHHLPSNIEINIRQEKQKIHFSGISHGLVGIHYEEH